MIPAHKILFMNAPSRTPAPDRRDGLVPIHFQTRANGLRAFRCDSSTNIKPGKCGSSVTRSRQIGDRKSTRLNSSHLVISYAVFCLKKKKNEIYLRIKLDIP